MFFAIYTQIIVCMRHYLYICLYNKKMKHLTEKQRQI